MTARRNRPALRVDRLEDRTTPAVWGNPWPDPGHMTLSFAPDGTAIGGSPSSLFSLLGPGAAAADWQLEVLRAFQTWAAAGNINLSLTADSGTPFGAPGPAQGSPFHGDIRIGAEPLASSELAVGTPFDQFGSWSGAVMFNTGYAFTQNGQTGAYDLYTIALHEAGHVFGLPDSSNPASVMYSTYLGPVAGLSAGDVTALQQLYGVRTPDQFDQFKPNDSLQTATPIRFVADATALQGINPTATGNTYVAAGDVTTTADQDNYRFTVPAGVSDFFVQLRTSGISLFQARVNVFDASGRLLQSVAATDPRSGDLTLHISGVHAGSTYFVRVESATTSPFGIGSYRLAVGTDAYAAVFPPSPSYVNPDGNGNDSFGTATNMGVTRADGSPAWDLTVRASIEDVQDQDVYKFKTSTLTGGALVLSVWATEAGRLSPAVRVYDGDGNLLPADVLANDGAYYSIQIRNVPPNAVLFIEVAAADPSGPQNMGDYFLAVDERAQPIEIGHLASGTLTASAQQQAFQLTAAQDHLFHFTLSTSPAGTGTDSAVRLTILDDQNRLVATAVADAVSSASLDVLLTAGTYRVVITGATRDRTQPLPDLAYTLDGGPRTDPVGPQPEDPTAAPVGGQDPTSFFIGAITDTWLSFLDPYSNPWFGL